MMINELPKSTATIATTYFENVDDQSQFKKEMDYNMKLLSGLDPATTNQEIYEMNRQQEDTEIYGGTEQALLNIDDPEVRGFLANRMETFGAVKRSNPDLALQDFYTSTEEANRIVTNDVYRINYTNSKEDPHIYDTKYVIGMQKIYEAMESMEPNYGRLAFRYIGQPALSIGSTYLGGAIGGALTKTPAGVTKGATVGAGISDSLIAGWDSLALGGTIYNTQEKFVNVWHELLSDKSLTQEQFAQGVDDLVSGILMLDPAYQEEIFSAIVQSPNPFADGGLTFTSFGLKTFAQPLGALARMAKKPIGYFGKSSVFKRMELNEKLVDTIKKEMSNKVDEDIVNENINTKVSQVAPEDVSEKTVETVKGIMKDEETDNKVMRNSNEDYSYSDISVSQEDITIHNSASTVAKMNEEPTTTLYEIIPESRRPKQNYYIDHGKGVDNLPMTWEEAVELQKKLQGRYMQYSPWTTGFSNHGESYTSKPRWNPEVEPEYIAIQSASPEPFSKNPEKAGVWDYEGTQNKHTGDQWAMPGGYASSFDSPWVAAKGYYLVSGDKSGALEAREIINKFYNKFLDDSKREKAIEYFDKDGKLKQKIVNKNPLISDDENAINEKYNKALAARYALVEFFKEHGAKESTIDRVVEASKRYGADYLLDDGNDLSEHIDILQHASREGVEPFKKSDKDIIKEFNAVNYLFKQQQLYIKNGQVKAAESLEEQIKNRFTFLFQSVMNYEFEKHLKDMVSDPNFETKSKYLNTLGSINPMKHLEGMFYFDPKHGLVPFGTMFDRPKNDKYVQEWADSISNGFDSIESIKKDIADAIKKEGKLYKGKEVEWVGLPDNPEPWDVKDIYYYSKGENDTEFNRMVDDYVKENSKDFGEFQNMIARNLFPDVADDKDKLYPIFRKYLEDKGFKQVWHNLSGGRSQSFNVSIQDFNTITPVILEEKNLDRPWNVQKGFNNSHMIVSAGDGVGYYVRELHGVEGAKPMIIKGGKVVDFGDYKPYNSKK